MSIPRPRNILEESYENIERDIQGHCNYLALQKREVMRHGREPKLVEMKAMAEELRSGHGRNEK